MAPTKRQLGLSLPMGPVVSINRRPPTTQYGTYCSFEIMLKIPSNSKVCISINVDGGMLFVISNATCWVADSWLLIEVRGMTLQKAIDRLVSLNGRVA